MSDTLDELLSALADDDRRRVLGYFYDTSEDVATVDELAAYLADGSRSAAPAEPDPIRSAGRGRFASRLHHSVLPKLADEGAVEYDPRSETVRYRGGPVLERLLERAADVGDEGTERVASDGAGGERRE
ncbi:MULTISPECIES: DUF7344 domain-containing protein [Halorussus]|uniref:DUF7344 domain-containing protein n=1 Tax=Halorussus TaxID=1070314 RepID=UPI00209D8730|nr:hypothetical protein [Halorussus vallis]